MHIFLMDNIFSRNVNDYFRRFPDENASWFSTKRFVGIINDL